MAFGLSIHRSDSIYNDVPSERHQFPKQYLSRAREFEGDWIVCLEPSKVKNTKGYLGVEKVQEIIPDQRISDMYLAVIEPGTYLDFGVPVPFRDDTRVVERGILHAREKISGRAQAALRPLSQEDFARIVERGLGLPVTFCIALMTTNPISASLKHRKVLRTFQTMNESNR